MAICPFKLYYYFSTKELITAKFSLLSKYLKSNKNCVIMVVLITMVSFFALKNNVQYKSALDNFS